MNRGVSRKVAAGLAPLLLVACARAAPDAVSHAPDAPGFLWGL